ncbi:putative MFS-type transporter PB1E7.08c [Hypsizygus marmoreus]|uniref:MFS-type transporter PB1E7.08c n=1 Tax=Hypsizygus marmoreus TaxID=39966 RepID=A0A369J157_HYPMA|nr:putative MFS-type transporter PB1E7.08c [Hypsizygus marmoreus]
MASITPRASGWADQYSRMTSSYFTDEDEDVENQSLIAEDEAGDGRTPLDKTIDRIGMGSYQWTLLSLCGFGWMADNMWIQAVAIILPRVQQHYDVPDSYIGTVSSSMFAGMMFGAVGWGTCSDLMGRITAFNATLFFTAIFGLLASCAQSFPVLCVLLFFLGSAVGGSMPTDGTLLLEHMPKSKQYLVTALSVFFSIGAVFSAVVSLLVIPQNSCFPSQPCDVDSENQGWRYLLISLGLITLSMFLARIVFFRLHESPRYLVHAGRPLEAIESLQMISRFNGSDLSLEIEDVYDHQHPHPVASPNTVEALRVPALPPLQHKKHDPRVRATSTTSFSANAMQGDELSSSAPNGTGAANGNGSARPLVTHYNSTDASPIVLDGHSYATPAVEYPPIFPTPERREEDEEDSALLKEDHPTDPSLQETSPIQLPSSPSHIHIPSHTPRPRRPSSANRSSHRISTASARRTSSIYEQKVCESLPRWLRRPLWAWWDRVMMVLSPEWLRTTVFVWATWFSMSLAYTMFNVFLPKLLETGSSNGPAVSILEAKTLEESLWDVVIFTIGGCPGAILGAYLIESPLGRRWSLAGSTFITAFFCVVFVMVESSWAVRASTVGISLSATAMWAVLYGWTPEIFGTKVRGTACGIASALSRIGGMIAPMLGGVLLMMDRAFPVYTSVVIFAIAGLCVLMLREGEGDSGDRAKGERVVVH